ncbi:MAG: hypothetical protein ACK412_04425 [Chloroherpetonaceae bacterium]
MPKTMPLSELTEQAIAVLCKEFGIANTIRFLNQYEQGTGNYTVERETRFKDLTLEEYLTTLQTLRKNRSTL